MYIIHGLLTPEAIYREGGERGGGREGEREGGGCNSMYFIHGLLTPEAR